MSNMNNSADDVHKRVGTTDLNLIGSNSQTDTDDTLSATLDPGQPVVGHGSLDGVIADPGNGPIQPDGNTQSQNTDNTNRIAAPTNGTELNPTTLRPESGVANITEGLPPVFDRHFNSSERIQITRSGTNLNTNESNAIPSSVESGSSQVPSSENSEVQKVGNQNEEIDINSISSTPVRQAPLRPSVPVYPPLMRSSVPSRTFIRMMRPSFIENYQSSPVEHPSTTRNYIQERVLPVPGVSSSGMQIDSTLVPASSDTVPRSKRALRCRQTSATKRASGTLSRKTASLDELATARTAPLENAAKKPFNNPLGKQVEITSGSSLSPNPHATTRVASAKHKTKVSSTPPRKTVGFKPRTPSRNASSSATARTCTTVHYRALCTKALHSALQVAYVQRNGSATLSSAAGLEMHGGTSAQVDAAIADNDIAMELGRVSSFVSERLFHFAYCVEEAIEPTANENVDGYRSAWSRLEKKIANSDVPDRVLQRRLCREEVGEWVQQALEE